MGIRYKVNVILNICFGLQLFSLGLKGQVGGLGFSLTYKLSDKVDARKEALLNAQENAAINAGGNVMINTSNRIVDSNIKATGKRDKSHYNSVRNSLRLRSINSFVKTNGLIRYDTLREGHKNYRIKAEGRFDVNFNNLGTFLPEMDNIGETITVELEEHDCYGSFYHYAREYFAQKQNSIFLSSNKLMAKENDFRLDLFSNHISLSDLRSLPAEIIFTAHFDSCNDLITASFDHNEVLDNIRQSIFLNYIIISDED